MQSIELGIQKKNCFGQKSAMEQSFMSEFRSVKTSPDLIPFFPEFQIQWIEPEAKHSQDIKKLFATLSNHAGITWVIRFCTNVEVIPA